MPELPEVEALAAFLREGAVGAVVERIDVVAFTALKTVDPPTSALHGSAITGVGRFGKFLDVQIDRPGADPFHLITHLARGGWLHWRDAVPPAPPRPGKGPLALRVHLGGGAGWDLTEAGTQKRLACYVVHDPAQVPGIARLGPDPLDPLFTPAALADRLAGNRGQLKRILTDQTVLAGIGNAYSDEILHAARLSPFASASRLTEAQIGTLHAAMTVTLRDALARSVGQRAATLKAEKRGALRVHARTGLPCPVCGDTIREVRFADSSWQYCPACQTEGRLLADRRLSRLVK